MRRLNLPSQYFFRFGSNCRDFLEILRTCKKILPPRTCVGPIEETIKNKTAVALGMILLFCKRHVNADTLVSKQSPCPDLQKK
jgi:hypothetical protein